MNTQPRPEWQTVTWQIIKLIVGWTLKFLCAVTIICFTVTLTFIGAGLGALRKSKMKSSAEK